MNTLHTAAATGDLDRLRFLLSIGADPNELRHAPRYHGEHPLSVAMIYGQPEALRLLLEAGARPTMAAVSRGLCSDAGFSWGKTKAPLLELVLQYGFNPNEPRDREDGTTLLMSIIDYTEGPELARLLLEHGADIHARDKEQNTALMYAVRYSTNEDSIRLLCRYGADMDAQDMWGRTALINTLYIHHEDWDMLTNRRAPIDYLEWEEDKEYFQECDARRQKLLLDCGANPHICDHRGWPALLHALAIGNLPSARLLLEHGATLDGVNKKNIRRARRVMTLHHYTRTLRLLTELTNTSPPGNDNTDPCPHPAFRPRSECVGSRFFTFERKQHGNQQEDILCIDEDELFASGLYFLLEDIIHFCNPYDDCELTQKDWKQLHARAAKLRGRVWHVCEELSDWVEHSFRNGERSIFIYAP